MGSPVRFWRSDRSITLSDSAWAKMDKFGRNGDADGNHVSIRIPGAKSRFRSWRPKGDQHHDSIDSNRQHLAPSCEGRLASHVRTFLFGAFDYQRVRCTGMKWVANRSTNTLRSKPLHLAKTELFPVPSSENQLPTPPKATQAQP